MLANSHGYHGTVKDVTNVAVVLYIENGEVVIPNEEALKRGSFSSK